MFIVNGDNNEDANCALLKSRYKVLVSKISLAMNFLVSWWHPLICMAAIVHTGAKLLSMILDIALFPVLLLSLEFPAS